MHKTFLLLITVVLSFCSSVYANNYYNIYNIKVRIESYDKTIVETTVAATTFTTFIEALQRVGHSENIDIIILHNDKGNKEIYSIDGITTRKFNNFDGWNGFLIRDNQIIEPYNILDQLLKANDELVIYYGNIKDTKKVGEIDILEYDNGLSAKIVSEYTTGVENHGDWKLSTITEEMENVNVHLSLVNDKKVPVKIVTNKDGLALFNIEHTGFYSIYAEGYITDNYPIIVKTPVKKLLLGIDNDYALTRGEFVAVIVNFLSNGAHLPQNTYFTDLHVSHKYYNEILTAFSNGLVSGYSDKTFKPNKNISLLEACVILSRIIDSADNEIIDYPLTNIPNWAINDINKILSIGLIDNINLDWNDDISKDIAEHFFNVLTLNFN